MIADIGNASLCAAVLVAAIGILAAVSYARFGAERARKTAKWSITIVAAMFTVASGALLTALLTNDFHFQYVIGYSERALPTGYKIAAFWAGQEGSLLLWAWLLGVMSVCAVIGFRKWHRPDHAIALLVIAASCGFFGAMLLFAANPFEMVPGMAPGDGRGLNPMLQDPGMIIHPPLLFLGYAGYTIPFAVMIGVLTVGRADNRWLSLVRRWLIVSWIFLTAGIVLGAWWAYVELGWGGYWAWDPVENASLLPWLTSTALLHSIMVQQHRGMFKIWNVALIALSFILCIFGTYLTRSGVIDSVHAFPKSGIGWFFLTFLGVSTVASIALILGRLKALRAEHQIEGLISREGAFLAGNILLTIMMLTTLVGTIFPLLSGIFGESISVGPPFYNKIVAPMGILLAFIMAHGPVLAFGKAAASKIARSMTIPGIVAVAITLGVALVYTRNIWALVCTFIAVLGTFAVIVGFFRSASARKRSTGENYLVAAIRLIDRDHRRYGGQLAHLGMILIVVGVAGSSLFALDETLQLRRGQQETVGDYTVRYVSLEEVRDVNFTAVRATVEMTAPDGAVTTLRPEKRFYDKWAGEPPNSEVSIRSNLYNDLYVILAGWESGGEIVALQVLVSPLVIWIWLGGILMMLAGLFCIVPPLIPRARHATIAEPVRAGGEVPDASVEVAMPAASLKAETSA